MNYKQIPILLLIPAKFCFVWIVQKAVYDINIINES